MKILRKSYAIPSSFYPLVVLFLFLGQFAESANPHTKALLSPTIAHQICKQTRVFSQRKKIQPPIVGNRSLLPQEGSTKSCQFYTWTLCVERQQCERFKRNTCLIADKGRLGPKQRRTQKGKSPSTRIFIGEHTNLGELPYQMLVTNLDVPFKARSKCGGTLIHPSYVLTAAHCIKSPGAIPINRLDIVAGKHNFAVDNEPHVQIRKVKREFVHENFIVKEFHDDIALLELDEPFIFNDYVQVARVPPHGFEFRGLAVVSGWGDNEKDTEVLQKKSFYHQGKSVCSRKDFGFPVTNNMMCACTGTATTCFGDSGGPLTQMINGAPAKCQMLVGVINNGENCVDDISRPQCMFYANVSFFRDWISSKINPTDLIFRRSADEPEPKSESRVNQGQQASLNEFPFHARITKSGQTICGAAILTNIYVLTSAYCVAKQVASTLKVVTGGNAQNQKGDEHQVRLILFHPEFDIITYDHDIAIIQLATEINLSGASQKEISLPDEFAPTPAQLQFTGFGATGSSNQRANHLIKLTMKPISRQKCRGTYGCFLDTMGRSVMCAEPSSGGAGGICRGDFGGPLSFKANGKDTLFGIATFRSSCTQAMPSIFTKVSPYIEWIFDEFLEPFIPTITEQPPPLVIEDNPFPYLAYVSIQPGKVCSGVLIHPVYVITTASCIYGAEASQVSVSAGKIRRGQKGSLEQVSVVDELIPHYAYKTNVEGGLISYASRNASLHDIALLKLLDPLYSSQTVQPALIPAANLDFKLLPNPFVALCGWQKPQAQQTDNTPWVHLQALDLNCEAKYRSQKSRSFFRLVRENEVCAPGSLCNTEPGLTMSTEIDAFHCHIVLGILNEDLHCPFNSSDALPAIFSKLSYYYQWIQDSVDVTALRSYTDGPETRDLRRRKKRMLGGSPASPNEFPFMVQVWEENVFLCSGAVVNINYVITAASCVANSLPLTLSIVAGEDSLTFTNRARQVVHMHLHPDFDKLTSAHNLAFLLLTTPLTLSNTLTSVTFPTNNLPTPNVAIASGWWSSSGEKFEPQIPSLLQKVQMEIMPNTTCWTAYGCSFYPLKDTTWCTKADNKTAGCIEDKGAILTTAVGDQHVFLGVGSLGPGCFVSQVHFPTVFTRISEYTGWIINTTAFSFFKSPVTEDERPFQVIVKINGAIRGSGTILTSSHVLTTASILTKPFLVIPSQVQIQAGTLSTNQNDGQTVVCSEIKIHEEFDQNTLRNDVAILQLQRPLQLNSKVKPIGIASTSYKAAGHGILSGWSMTAPGPTDRSATLNKAPYPILDDHVCHEQRGITTHFHHEGWFCTHRIVDKCVGDPGSPLTQVISHGTPGQDCAILVGILSQGNDCGDQEKPSVYMDMSYFHKWIGDAVFAPGASTSRSGTRVRKSRMAGGTPVDRAQYPYQLGIGVWGASNKPFIQCSATIISKFSVLTSAYCVYKMRAEQLFLIISNTEKRNISNVFLHKKFDVLTRANDIAVLRASSQLPLNRKGQYAAIGLAPRNAILSSADLFVTGYGRMVDTPPNNNPVPLQSLNMKKMNYEDCVFHYGCSITELKDQVICATPLDTSSPNKGICLEDQGGPLMIKSNDRDNKRKTLLIGIASFRLGCNTGNLPSIFTDVDAHRHFIKTFIATDNANLADETEYKFQVMIDFRGALFCVGAIINSDYILTTASCFEKMDKVNLNQIRIHAGLFNSRNPHKDTQHRGVKKLYKHEGYDKNKVGVHDIALVLVSSPFVLNDYVQPAMIPTAGLVVTDDSPAFVSGWPFSSTDTESHGLQEESVSLESDAHCKAFYSQIPQVSATDDNICAKSKTFSACVNITGATLSQRILKPLSGCHYLLGLASQNCQTQQPRVFMKLHIEYTHWIQRKISVHDQLEELTTRSTRTRTRTSTSTSRLSGGVRATNNEFPYKVRLIRKSNLMTFCGGVLYQTAFVITSAMCVHQENATEIQAMLSDYHLNLKDEFEVSRNIFDIIVHEEFNAITQENDIAALLLDRPLDGTIAKVRLGRGGGVPNMIVAGWGGHISTLKISQLLRKHVMQPVTPGDCIHAYGCTLATFIDKVICARGQNIHDGICYGDRGAPLVVPSGNREFRLLGIASFRDGCTDSHLPSVFTSVSFHRDWIRDTASLFAGQFRRD